MAYRIWSAAKPRDSEAGQAGRQLPQQPGEVAVERLRQGGRQRPRARAKAPDGGRQRHVRRRPDQEVPEPRPDTGAGCWPRSDRAQMGPPLPPAGVDDEGITDVVAAHLDDVEGLGRRHAARALEERVHLARQVEVDAVVVGPRGADSVVGDGRVRRGQGRPHAVAEAHRSRILLDPRRAVAEVVAALRIGRAGNEQRVQLEVRRRARVAHQGERVARVREAGAEDHDAREG